MSRPRLLLGLAFLGLVSAPNIASAEKLERADFFSHTNDDNKDKDTGVWVKVCTNDEKVELATIENAANSSKDETEFNDNSEHTINLVVKSIGATMAQADGFKFKIGSKANGNDKWKFRGKVTLHFDNGQTLVKEIGDTELNSRGSKYVETGWTGGK